MRAPLLANKIDGDCFALVRAHQHGITIHNQDVMRERESGVILFITYYYGGEGGELGNSKISIVYSASNLQGPLFNIFGCAIIRHTKFDTHSSFLPLCR